MKKRVLSLLLALVMVVWLLPVMVLAAESDYVAQVGEDKYETLLAAIGAVENNGTITVLKDITATSALGISSGKTFTIDLGGHTVSHGLYVLHGNLTVQNGTLNRTQLALVVAGSNDAADAGTDYSVLTVAKDANVLSDYSIYVIPTYTSQVWPVTYGMKINIYGTLEGTPAVFISGNIGYDNYKANIGNEELSLPVGINAPSAAMKKYGPEINVYGTLTSPNSGAFILNGMARVSVYEGASVTGHDGFDMKSGVLNVHGGTITSIGEKVDPVPAVNSGAEASGAAISVTSYYTNNFFDDAANITVSIVGGTIVGTNNAAVLVAHSFSNGVPSLFRQGVDLAVSGGNLVSKSGTQGVIWIAPKVDGDADTYPTKFITGGYFTSEPADTYIADGYGVTISDKVGYAYMVMSEEGIAAMNAKPDVAEPAVDTDNLSHSGITGSNDEIKQKVENAANSVVADTLVEVAKDEAAAMTEGQVSAAVNDSLAELKKVTGNEDLNTDDVYVYTQAYMDVKAESFTKDKDDNYTLELNITPKVRVVASTAETATDITAQNSVEISDKTVTITEPTVVTLQLPAEFANAKVHIKHEASNGIHNYVVKADGNAVISFTTKHGFSPMTFSTDIPDYAAQIGDEGFMTLEEALAAVGEDKIIDLLKLPTQPVEVTGTASFTVYIAGDLVEKVVEIVGSDPKAVSDYVRAFFVAGSNTERTFAGVMPEDENSGALYVNYEFVYQGIDAELDKWIPIFAGDLPYTDVAQSDAIYDAVAYAYRAGLMVGTAPDKFSPGMTLSRAMIWTILARLNGVSTETWLNQPWYYAAQQWAMAEGITDGLRPDAPVTRLELVTMLWRYSGKPMAATDVADAASVPAWGLEALRWGVENDLIPASNWKQDATRAETAIALYNM